MKDREKEENKYKLENDNFIENGENKRDADLPITSNTIKIMVQGYFKHVKFKDEEVEIEGLLPKNKGAAPGPGNMIQ